MTPVRLLRLFQHEREIRLVQVRSAGLPIRCGSLEAHGVAVTGDAAGRGERDRRRIRRSAMLSALLSGFLSAWLYVSSVEFAR